MMNIFMMKSSIKSATKKTSFKSVCTYAERLFFRYDSFAGVTNPRLSSPIRMKQEGEKKYEEEDEEKNNLI